MAALDAARASRPSIASSSQFAIKSWRLGGSLNNNRLGC
jgi:hypothetical protein